ncbi:Ig-like domain-containing protein, partial [Vibrio fortis]
MQEGAIAVTFTASDSAGNQASNSSLSLNLDKTAPTFDSNNSTPNDNATGVTVGDNIVIDFSEVVTLLNGQIITLADVTNGVIGETFTATSTNAASGNNGGTISVSSDKVTLNPGTDLLAGTEYAVQVSASAIQDLAGNSFAGISDNTTFSFRTAPTLALSASATEMSEKGGSVTYTVSLQDGKANPFTASENIVAAIQFGGTATKDTDYSVTGLSSSDDITIASGSSSATLSVTATDDVEEDDAETIVVVLNSVSSGTATISSGSSASVTINENNPPVFSNLDAAPAFTEDGSAVIIDGDATVSDTELDALNGGNGNYDGATLTIARSGGASGNDLFANNGLLSALNEGEDLVYNGTTIGTVTSNSNGTLILTFNSSATTALVNSVLQNITYSNSANEPAGSVVLSFTFNDGTENSSGTNQVTANITASNDAPTLTASAANPTFTEGGSAATVFSSANV